MKELTEALDRIEERLFFSDGPYHIGHMNENADRADVENGLNEMVAEDTPYYKFLVRAPEDMKQLVKALRVAIEGLDGISKIQEISHPEVMSIIATNSLALIQEILVGGKTK